MKIIHRKGALHKVPDALSRAYEGDEHCLAAVGAVEPDKWYIKRRRDVEKFPDKFPDYKVDENLLYKHTPNPLIHPIIPDLDSWKLVVPEPDRERVLFEAHNTPQSGHLGIDKTYHRLSLLYYWPGMHRDATKYVKECLDCQLHKPSQQAPMGLMGKRKLSGPWATVSGDIMGPYPPTKSGFKFIIVWQDLFTKWVEIRPLRKANAQTILKSFEELVLFRWGFPLTVVTDNGSEFWNQEVEKKLRELGIIQTPIAIYHAQANPTERCNRTIKPMVTIFTGKDQRNWDIHLHEFAFAINTSVHASTLVTPAFLNFGRNPRSIDTYRQSIENPTSYKSIDLKEWADRLQRLPAIYDLVRKNLDKSNEKQARYYNTGRREVLFKKMT